MIQIRADFPRGVILLKHLPTTGDKPSSDSDIILKSAQFLDVQWSWVLACKVTWNLLHLAPPATKQLAYSWEPAPVLEGAYFIRENILCPVYWVTRKPGLWLCPEQALFACSRSRPWSKRLCLCCHMTQHILWCKKYLMRRTELHRGVGRICLVLRSSTWHLLVMVSEQVPQQGPASSRTS